MLTHVIFDYDGTLENWHVFEAAVDRKLAKAVHSQFALDEEAFLGEWQRIKRLHVHPQSKPEEYSRVLWLVEAFAAFGTQAPIETVDALVNDYWRWIEERVELQPHATETLKALAKRFTLAVFSDSDGNKPTKLHRIRKLGIEPYFAAIFTSDDFGVNKPDPAAFAAVAERLGTAPQRCVMVGDVPERDLAGAKAAGMHTVFTAFLPGQPAGHPAIDYVIHDFDELPPLLFAHAKDPQ